MESSLAVRRADGANTPSAKRSVKIWRPHRTASQRKRRAITRSCTIRPERGRSVTRRRYRLWTRRETVPQDGHRPTLPDARTAITALLPSKYALSTTNPLGTRLERWSACCMALILPAINAPDIPKTASKVSQSQYCRPNDTPRRQVSRHRSRDRHQDEFTRPPYWS